MVRITAKRKVLNVHPGATAKQWSHAWCIERTWPPAANDRPLGEGKTAGLAWKDAARRLK